MRFSILATSVMATAVLANYPDSYPETSTSYYTEVITKTQCAETVTNCPAHSTIVSTTSYPVVSPPASSVYYNVSTPVYPTSSYVAPPASSYVAPPPASSAGGELTSSYSLSTLTISTCVPTVIYSTVTVTPSPVSTPAGPVGGSTGTISIPHNVTAPTSPAAPITPASGASSVQGSIIIAAVAGLSAFLFA